MKDRDRLAFLALAFLLSVYTALEIALRLLP